MRFLLVCVLLLYSFIVLASSEAACADKPMSNQSLNCLGIKGKPQMLNQKNTVNKNVLGKRLQACGTNPQTGFYRTGDCQTGPNQIRVTNCTYTFESSPYFFLL